MNVAHPTMQAQRVIGIAVDDVRLTPLGWHGVDVAAFLQSLLLVLVVVAIGRWLRSATGWSMFIALLVIMVGTVFRRGDAANAIHDTLLLAG
jgi:hypothetical protein